MKDTLELFIKENKLEFTQGRRNSDCVVICGLALQLNKRDKYKHKPKEIIESLLADKLAADPGLQKELDRVYVYARANNYEDWWGKEENSKAYKF